MNDIVKLAIDTYRHRPEKYSMDEALTVLQKALVDANGGDTKLDMRKIRDGKCNGLFTIIEEIIPLTIHEGLTGDEYFNAMVDYRNVALGDKNLFLVEDSTLFEVDEIAPGSQALRRQRLGSFKDVSLKTSYKGVKIYEELERVLSGQVDFNKFIDKVGESFRKHMLNDIYTAWEGITADDLGATYFPAAGTYSESALLDLIAHVEAAADGKPATVIGTAKALRNLAPAIQGSDSKSDLYNLGYYGKFYGTDCVKLPQRHRTGTTNFIYDDNKLTIIAGDEKPIKFVNEGNAYIHIGDPWNNADLTQEYTYMHKYGLGIVVAGNAGIGRYEMTT